MLFSLSIMFIYFQSIARAEPGTVPVVFETPTGDEVGKTQFTYVDKEEQEFRRFLQSTELQYSFFTRLAGQQGKLGGRGENVTENSDTFGKAKHFISVASGKQFFKVMVENSRNFDVTQGKVMF